MAAGAPCRQQATRFSGRSLGPSPSSCLPALLLRSPLASPLAAAGCRLPAAVSSRGGAGDERSRPRRAPHGAVTGQCPNRTGR